MAPTAFGYKGKPISIHGLLDFLELYRAAGNRRRQDPPRRAFDKSCYIGCGVTTGVGAVVNTAKVTPGANVVVFGLAGSGSTSFRARGWWVQRQIIGVDLNDSKEEWPPLWHDHFVNPSKVGGQHVAHLSG